MGELAKISGPVIVAEKMAGAQVNEVVKVGKEELLGEIIALKQDRATIQVYEDTSGLKPGDPIAGTGAPLQVELGPGLVSSVFDGIQRPLDVIMDKTGAFIARGVNIPALDQNKKWEFKPVAKKGQKVKPGDVLGTVAEGSIVHKILVPAGVEGAVDDIEAGKFTVKQPVAKVGGKPVAMAQKWPVRVPRASREKQAVNTPMITGTRILDTFFPVAKGGAAAIPGPFGAGKCVSGDTPILTTDGLRTMREVYDNAVKNGRSRKTAFEEVIDLDEPLRVFTFANGCIQPASSKTVYRGGSDSLLRIRTRSGRVLDVTPVHKLFRVTDAAEIRETPAQELHPGDFIATARKIPVAGNAGEAQAPAAYALGHLRVQDTLVREELRRVAKKLLQAVGASVVARDTGLSRERLQQLAYRSTRPRVNEVEKLFSYAALPLPNIEAVSGERHGNPARVPQEMTAELAEFLGLFAAEGNIRGRHTLVFTNTDESLLARFQSLTSTLFGVPSKIQRQKGKAPAVLANSKALADFVAHHTGRTGARNKRVPPAVLTAPDACASSFLSAYYLGDGSFSRKEVEFATASKELQTGLSYLLARFGIPCSLKERRVKGTAYYRVFVRGRDNLATLGRALGEGHEKTRLVARYARETPSAYTRTDVVPVSPAFVQAAYEKAGRPYALLKKGNVEITNYTRNGEKMSAHVFQSFARVLHEVTSSRGHVQEQTSLLRQFAEALEWIQCDEIASIEVLPGPHDVFDIVLPDSENWIGGNAPSILHNTVTQQTLAKYADADVIVYVGCGERGNEMTEVLTEFPKLQDPKTGRPLMERTVLIANTSNMPVAAREASIYTGITIAEYYRDMGYSVALMADSTSRWAEAMREISGRLEEMPGEEGYPAYLTRRLAEFYERSGRVTCLGSDNRQGSVTVVGAVSPPGGDISEPVSQGTLRITKVFWALDANLSRRRHFPAINWLKSYSLYHDELREWFEKNVSPEFTVVRTRAMELLQKEAELQNIVQLIGPDALPERERLVLEATKMIREDFLQQNSFDEVDAYSTLQKQYWMLKTVLHFYDKAVAALALDVPLEKITFAKEKEDIARLKRVPEKDAERTCKDVMKRIDAAFGRSG